MIEQPASAGGLLMRLPSWTLPGAVHLIQPLGTHILGGQASYTSPHPASYRYPDTPRILQPRILPLLVLLSLTEFPFLFPLSSSCKLLFPLQDIVWSPPPGSSPVPFLPSCWSTLTPEPALSSTMPCCLLQRGADIFEYPTDQPEHNSHPKEVPKESQS